MNYEIWRWLSLHGTFDFWYNINFEWHHYWFIVLRLFVFLFFYVDYSKRDLHITYFGNVIFISAYTPTYVSWVFGIDNRFHYTLFRRRLTSTYFSVGLLIEIDGKFLENCQYSTEYIENNDWTMKIYCSDPRDNHSQTFFFIF